MSVRAPPGSVLKISCRTGGWSSYRSTISISGTLISREMSGVRMATRSKIALRLVAIVGCALVLAILLFPVLFNLDRYRPQIISYFEQTTGKKVEIERVALTFS